MNPSGSILDRKGLRYGNVLVRERVGTSKRGAAIWQCVCDCGTEIVLSADQLRRLHSPDCGCRLKRRTTSATVHNAAARPEHSCWSSMWTRCTWSGSRDYSRYGGRGISVCGRWRDFAAFLEDMGPRPSRDHSIDRINNDGNYEPGNCRWATRSEQQRNRRNSVIAIIDGAAMPIHEAAAVLGISEGAVAGRVKRGSLRRAADGSASAFDREAALRRLIAKRDRLTDRIARIERDRP